MFKITCMKCGAETFVTPYLILYRSKTGEWYNATLNFIGPISVYDVCGDSPEGIEFSCESCENTISEASDPYRR